MKKIFKKPIVFILIAVALIVAGYFYFNRQKTPTYEFSVAKRGEVIQEVSVTGQVKPAESVDLAFEKTGKVSHIYVEVGDKVKQGQLLVSLDNADIAAQLAQAEADVKTQKAKLDELKAGTREEEIKVKEAELKKAQQDLSNDYDSVNDVLNDAYNYADDAVRKQMDQLFTNDEESNPQLSFATPNSQAKNDVESQRAILSKELNNWKNELNLLNATSSVLILDNGLENAKSRLTLIRNFLNRMMDTLVGAVALSQTTIDTYKANINTSRTNINTVLTSVNNQQQTISSQKLTVDEIQKELNLELAGTVPEQITAQEAQVEQAQANVLNYQAQLAKTNLSSPIDGIVTKQDTKVGEIVSANGAIVSIMSSAKFEIDANIPEADIAKVKVGDSASITLDAYGEGVVFDAKTIEIEPAETMVEGVATYKTTFQFINEDERIKSGMTANIDILTDKRENVIVIPQRAITTTDGDKIVKILTGDNIVSEVKVQIGLRGSDGNAEITGGIQEGDKIITSEK